MSFKNLEKKSFFSAAPEFQIIVITGILNMLGLGCKNDK